MHKPSEIGIIITKRAKGIEEVYAIVGIVEVAGAMGNPKS